MGGWGCAAVSGGCELIAGESEVLEGVCVGVGEAGGGGGDGDFGLSVVGRQDHLIGVTVMGFSP